VARKAQVLIPIALFLLTSTVCKALVSPPLCPVRALPRAIHPTTSLAGLPSVLSCRLLVSPYFISDTDHREAARPPTAPAYYGHRQLSHGDLPAIEVSPDWLSAGAQPLMLGAPWRSHQAALDTRTSKASLARRAETRRWLPRRVQNTAPLDIGPFEMDPVIPSDPSSAAASASTQERPGDLLPWGKQARSSPIRKVRSSPLTTLPGLVRSPVHLYLGA
jgi:hypothetical protein